MRQIARLLFGICILGLGNAQAEFASVNVPYLPNGGITIDGLLNETAWSNAVSRDLVYLSGKIDQDADCKTTMKLAWDSQYLYVGIQFKDDLHYAMNSQYLDAANSAYDDDGLQLQINPDFDDATRVLNSMGQFGISYVKGFGNLDPSKQYAGWWNSLGPAGWSTGNLTKAEQTAKGITDLFVSMDGLNFTYEAKFAWNSWIMTYKGYASSGDSIAFDLMANDNDGGFAAEGSLSWTGKLASQTVERWGKLILTGGPGPGIGSQSNSRAGIHPVRITGNIIDIGSLAQANTVSIRLFDLRGRLSKTVFNGELPAGAHKFALNAFGPNAAHPSLGVYIVNVKIGSSEYNQRVVRPGK